MPEAGNASYSVHYLANSTYASLSPTPPLLEVWCSPCEVPSTGINDLRTLFRSLVFVFAVNEFGLFNFCLSRFVLHYPLYLHLTSLDSLFRIGPLFR
jgi:hypothetical protein